MSKAYLLIICLLAASFTGCLGSDEPEDLMPTPVIEEEEELIDPVGTGDNGGNETNNYYYNNETYYDNETYYVNETAYLELISQVENLTAEVKALRLAIEEMQSSKYDVPENSSVWIHSNSYSDNRDWEIIKNGSVITIEYRGDPTSNYIEESSPRNCTVFPPQVTFYREDGVKIMHFSPSTLYNVQHGKEFWMQGVEIIRECTLVEGTTTQQYIEQFWSTIIITLPEEPARVDAGNGYYTFD